MADGELHGAATLLSKKERLEIVGLETKLALEPVVTMCK
jgi:hypothetical protein